jgi:outer membrane lipoprotein-sorting protein
MRTRVCIASGVLLLATGLVWSDDESARSLVDKAIQAAGGAKNLAKHKAATFSEKGTYYGMGDGLPFSGKYAIQRPKQFRMEIVDVFTIVLNGDKGWMKSQDNTKELSKEELQQQQTEARAGAIGSLLPLKNKAFNLKKLEDVKVDGKAAAGILVIRKGYPEVKLYFDKKTGLLVKGEHKTKSSEEMFKEVNQETYFSDYREIDGAKIAHKLVIKRDGKNYVEGEISDYEAKGKLDDSVFAQP